LTVRSLWRSVTRRALQRFEHSRQGSALAAAAKRLVGDDERSVLFRLKERCHALFRGGDRAPGIATQREALFDLAVGSLFHEAMKFRENLYQRTVYGPKVRALRSQSGPEAEGIPDLKSQQELDAYIVKLESDMREAAKRFEFEKAAKLRDTIKELRTKEFLFA